jgi:hypothetical protein
MVSIFILWTVITACAGSPLIIKQKASVVRTGVFMKYLSDRSVPDSMSLLSISASFKTTPRAITFCNPEIIRMVKRSITSS